MIGGETMSAYQTVAGVLGMVLLGFVLHWLGDWIWREEKRWARLE